MAAQLSLEQRRIVLLCILCSARVFAMTIANPRARCRMRLYVFQSTDMRLLVALLALCVSSVVRASEVLCHKWALSSDIHAIERACSDLDTCAGPSYGVPQGFKYSVPCSTGMESICEPLPADLSSCWDWQLVTDAIRTACPDLCTAGRRATRFLSAPLLAILSRVLSRQELKVQMHETAAPDTHPNTRWQRAMQEAALPPSPPAQSEIISFPNTFSLPDNAGVWVIPTVVILWTSIAALLLLLAFLRHGDPTAYIVFPDFMLADMVPEPMPVPEVQPAGTSVAPSGQSAALPLESGQLSSVSLARGNSIQVINNPLARFSGYLDSGSLLRTQNSEITAVGTIHVPNTRRPSVLRSFINTRASITKGDHAVGNFVFAGTSPMPEQNRTGDRLSGLIAEIERQDDGGSHQLPLALLQRIQATGRVHPPNHTDTDHANSPPLCMSPRPQQQLPMSPRGDSPSQPRPESSASGRLSRPGSVLGNLWRSLSRGAGTGSGDPEGMQPDSGQAYRPRAGTNIGHHQSGKVTEPDGTASSAAPDGSGVGDGVRNKRTFSGSQAPERKAVERPLWTKMRPSNAAVKLMTPEERAELDALEAKEAEEHRRLFEAADAALARAPPRTIAVQPTARVSVLKRPQWGVPGDDSAHVDDMLASPTFPHAAQPPSPGPLPLPFLQALVEASPQPTPRSPTLPANSATSGNVSESRRTSGASEEDRRSKSPPPHPASLVTLPQAQRARSSPGDAAAAGGSQRSRQGSNGPSPRPVRVGGGHALGPPPAAAGSIPASPKGIAKISMFRAPVPPTDAPPVSGKARGTTGRAAGGGGGVRFAAALTADSGAAVGSQVRTGGMSPEDVLPMRSQSPALSTAPVRASPSRVVSQKSLGRSTTALNLLADKFIQETGSPRGSNNGLPGSQNGVRRQTESGAHRPLAAQRSQGRMVPSRSSPLGDIVATESLPGRAEDP